MHQLACLLSMRLSSVTALLMTEVWTHLSLIDVERSSCAKCRPGWTL